MYQKVDKKLCKKMNFKNKIASFAFYIIVNSSLFEEFKIITCITL